MCRSICLDHTPKHVRDWILVKLEADTCWTIRLLVGPVGMRNEEKRYVSVPWDQVPPDVGAWFHDLQIGPGSKILLRKRKHTPSVVRPMVQARYLALQSLDILPGEAKKKLIDEFNYTERHIRRLVSEVSMC